MNMHISAHAFWQYVIHNVPSEDVISREAWMDHFFQSGIDTVFRTAFVHDETGHHFTFDMATLRVRLLTMGCIVCK